METRLAAFMVLQDMVGTQRSNMAALDCNVDTKGDQKFKQARMQPLVNDG